MRRKRRTKYQWFYPTGTVGPAADLEDTTNGREFSLNVPGNGTTAIRPFEMVTDAPPDDFNPGNPMGFYQNNDYFIKRIVGKFFASTSQLAFDNPPGILLGFGMFIARAADDDQSPGVPVPIAGTTIAAQIDEYSPLRAENMSEPWIWRRVWVLGNALSTSSYIYRQFPNSNTSYGSVADGPHIDAKTARRVRQGERLWGVIAAKALPLNITHDFDAIVQCYFDYRVLGQMRRPHNRSVF